MNSKEIAEMIEKLVDRTLFKLDDVPTSILKRLKLGVDREFDKRKDEPRVKLIAVASNGFIDKYFKEDDSSLAFEYARKMLNDQLEKGGASVSVGAEVAKISDVNDLINQKGRYE